MLTVHKKLGNYASLQWRNSKNLTPAICMHFQGFSCPKCVAALPQERQLPISAFGLHFWPFGPQSAPPNSNFWLYPCYVTII